MNFWNNKKIRCGIIAILTALCAVLAFVIRILPVSDLAGAGDMIAGPDAWYNLRLVEVLMNSGGYINYEAMTLFPTGQEIVWGPLFTYISAIFAILAGAASRIAIIDAVSWVPAVLGALMVPVMFFLGKKLGDWKTGLIAALFIAVIGGQFFSRTIYGYFDHHSAETLFSTLFCLCYVLALVHTQEKEIDWKKFSTLKIPLIFGIFSGVSYLLGLLTMTTLVVFGLFASIFTLIQFILDYRAEKPTAYLVILNILTFSIAAIGLLIYGIRDGFALTNYSLGLFITQIAVIAGVLILLGLTKIVDKLKQTRNLKRPWILYLMSIIIVAVVGILIFRIISPDSFSLAAENLINQFIASTGGSATVGEAQAWSVGFAVNSFGFSLLLALCGAAVLLVNYIQKKNPAVLFVLIWSLGMLVQTIGGIRWEYFFAVNISLLAAVFVSWAINIVVEDRIKHTYQSNNKTELNEDINSVQTKKTGRITKRGTIHKTNAKKTNLQNMIVLIIILIVSGAFVGLSTANSITTSSEQNGVTPAFWIDACEWLEENTPETGVDYYKLYNKDTFTYPETAYGIVAWWDFGHYITTIGNRIPVANPFQAGVEGEYGVAQILIETDEIIATEKMDYLNSKYVMVDYDTANNFFGIMNIWAGKNIETASDYYNSLAFRLYTLGGSEYIDKTENSSIHDIPALRHFRQVYDSPYYGAYENGAVVAKNTRIFEYVKGAVIKGTGTISTKITTNSGAGNYTYEQTSKDGQFVVPYATGKNGDVTASAYTIKETGQTFTVSEDAVLNGLTVN
ncbi:MAG TPA: oligosaccharyl transferase, archaeosortase A system-associated [Methanocorpusculum sp.]|nr:oligosaccharyl transferase, archaeosortase A system-associated [Methanocorpusculum sp.]